MDENTREVKVTVTIHAPKDMPDAQVLTGVRELLIDGIPEYYVTEGASFGTAQISNG